MLKPTIIFTKMLTVSFETLIKLTIMKIIKKPNIILLFLINFVFPLFYFNYTFKLVILWLIYIF